MSDDKWYTSSGDADYRWLIGYGVGCLLGGCLVIVGLLLLVCAG